MNNKTTLLLVGVVVAIVAVIGVGFMTAPSAPTPATHNQTALPTTKQLPTAAELAKQLPIEQPQINSAITMTFPSLDSLYTIERSKLYDDGSWYGAILQYKGGDVNNRDTLRIVVQKKNGTWTVRTHPPQLLISRHDIPDAPRAMIDDINAPAALLGAGDSPTITPSE